jgi:hypothetical protein
MSGALLCSEGTAPAFREQSLCWSPDLTCQAHVDPRVQHDNEPLPFEGRYGGVSYFRSPLYELIPSTGLVLPGNSAEKSLQKPHPDPLLRGEVALVQTLEHFTPAPHLWNEIERDVVPSNGFELATKRKAAFRTWHSQST